jgi:hypothetical protein
MLSTASSPRSGRLPQALTLAMTALLVVGCGSATRPPSPTPADFIGITQHLGGRGIVARDIVSGDAGCDDQLLAKTAIAFTASGVDQTSPVRTYLYIFRNRDAFDRNLGEVDACARSYVTDPATYEKIEISPYVASGQGPWAPDFRAALTDALTVAAGTGG